MDDSGVRQMGRAEVLDELVEKVRRGKLDEVESLGFKKVNEAEWVGYGLKIRVWQEDGLTFMEIRRAQ